MFFERRWQNESGYEENAENAEYLECADYAEYAEYCFLAERPKIKYLWIRIKYQIPDLSRPFGLVYIVQNAFAPPPLLNIW